MNLRATLLSGPRTYGLATSCLAANVSTAWGTGGSLRPRVASRLAPRASCRRVASSMTWFWSSEPARGAPVRGWSSTCVGRSEVIDLAYVDLREIEVRTERLGPTGHPPAWHHRRLDGRLRRPGLAVPRRRCRRGSRLRRPAAENRRREGLDRSPGHQRTSGVKVGRADHVLVGHPLGRSVPGRLRRCRIVWVIGTGTDWCPTGVAFLVELASRDGVTVRARTKQPRGGKCLGAVGRCAAGERGFR